MTPNAEIWRVLGYAPSQPFACRTCHHLRMIARVKPGASMSAAVAELDQIHARLENAYPAEYASVGAAVVPMQDEVTRGFRPALLALTGAVSLVLLIAMANVVNLQLARAERRRDEFAIRSALGAGRGRMTQQLLAEGLVLALLGGVAGLIVARVALPALTGYLPRELPRLGAIHLDAGGFAAVAALVLLLSVVMAVIPGSLAANELGASLRSGRRLASGAQHITRSTLVVAEVALAAMLLAAAALVGRSLERLLGVNAGFETSHLLSLEVDAVGEVSGCRESLRVSRSRADACAACGVAIVAVISQLPLGGNMDPMALPTSQSAGETRARAERRPLHGDARVSGNDEDSVAARPMVHAGGAMDTMNHVAREQVAGAASVARTGRTRPPIGWASLRATRGDRRDGDVAQRADANTTQDSTSLNGSGSLPTTRSRS